MAPDYAELLARFVRDDCTGRQYDSCSDSPCRHASVNGCQHPRHPKNTQAIKVYHSPHLIHSKVA